METDLTALEAYWGGDLVKVPADLLRQAALPARETAFLTRIGLPSRDNPLFPIVKNVSNLAQWRRAGQDYLVIADQHDQKLCIRLGDGIVLAIDARNELADRFVNASPSGLSAFLMIYLEAQSGLGSASDEQAAAIVAGIRKRFMQLDPEAMANEENWWPAILTQVEQGLM